MEQPLGFNREIYSSQHKGDVWSSHQALIRCLFFQNRVFIVNSQTVSAMCCRPDGNTSFPLGQHERTGRTGGQTGGPGQTNCRTVGQTDGSGGRLWWTGVLSCRPDSNLNARVSST